MADNKQQNNQRPVTEQVTPLSSDWARGQTNDNFVADTTKPPPRIPDKDSKNERR